MKRQWRVRTAVSSSTLSESSLISSLTAMKVCMLYRSALSLAFWTPYCGLKHLPVEVKNMERMCYTSRCARKTYRVVCTNSSIHHVKLSLHSIISHWAEVIGCQVRWCCCGCSTNVTNEAIWNFLWFDLVAERNHKLILVLGNKDAWHGAWQPRLVCKLLPEPNLLDHFHQSTRYMDRRILDKDVRGTSHELGGVLLPTYSNVYLQPIYSNKPYVCSYFNNILEITHPNTIVCYLRCWELDWNLVIDVVRRYNDRLDGLRKLQIS